MTEESDARLVEGARQGSAAAFERLVSRYQGEVVALARSLVGDRGEAEDLAQEAFVRAHRHLALLADPARFGAWLRRIAFGACIDHLRSRRAERGALVAGAALPDLPDPLPSPLEEVERAEMAARVKAAIARLPERYRVPLTLYHLDGLDHARVARALDVPPGTVRSLVTRARRQLAPLLHDYAREHFAVNEPTEEVFRGQEGPPARMLHLLNGDATAHKLERSGVPGTLAVWADILYEGPVPAELDSEAARETRARAIEALGYASVAGAREKQREWDAGLESYPQYDEVVIWLEHDLFDQLLLIRHLAWFAERESPPERLSLICIGEYPGVESFKGLGELTPDQLTSLLDTRQRVTPRHLELGRRAWRAFTAPTPLEVQRLLEGDLSPLPFLAPALRRLLEEYPEVESGLSRTEREILETAAAGPVGVYRLWKEVHARESAYYVTDGSLQRHLREMGAGARPLLTLDRPMDGEPLPDARVEITETGREVLAGREDRVALLGMDRWLGGVRLRDGGPAWRWDPRSRRIQG